MTAVVEKPKKNEVPKQYNFLNHNLVRNNNFSNNFNDNKILIRT